MSLTLSLNNALSGLRANQQAISTLSQNIANANTDGYSRQIVEQSAQYVAGVGSGVTIDDVVRKVDKYLQRATQTQGSVVSSTSTVSDYYARINTLLGQPGAGNTLDSFVTGFFNSLQSLAETPDRTSARADVVSAAGRLAGSVSGLAFNMEDLRFEADTEIRSSVDAVNGILGKLFTLNGALTSASGLGQSTAGLLDQRDAALRDLSSYMNISTSFSAAGAVNVLTGDGVPLVDGAQHKLSYAPSQSADQFVNGASLNALSAYTLDPDGNPVGAGSVVISGGTTGNITSQLTGGKIEGLRLMRDEVLPGMLDQMDELASNLRDAVNTIHNDGSGFPAATSLTGTRGVIASQQTGWSGNVRIAVLQKDGTPAPAAFADESYTGWQPLTLNLGKLDSGDGAGYPSMASIVNEINQHFSATSAKATLGNLNSIRLVSDTDKLTQGAPSTFNFDFDIQNISADNATFFLGGVTVKNDAGVDITNVTQSAPTIQLDPADSYYTTSGLPDVTLNLLPPQNVHVGDWIYVAPSNLPDVNGIPPADITGYFQVQAVGGNSITILAKSNAATTGDLADPNGPYIQTATSTVGAGQTVRSGDNGQIGVDLSASPNSAYYDITAAVATFDENGNIKTSNITYRVQNGTVGLQGDRFPPKDAGSVTDDGVYVPSSTTQDALHAILVDANGNEIHKVNGQYVDQSPSYLKIYSPSGNYTVAIDEMDSQEVGNVQGSPQTAGTDWGFSHYFGLNDFFAPNEQTPTGDATQGSAINLHVAQRLIDNPNLVTTGDLVQQTQSADPNAPPQYTYIRHSGDNQLATRLVDLANTNVTFDAAGGLPTIGLTFSGYTSQLLGYMASNSTAATDAATNAQTLYDGFKTRSDAISGVNLDEELANTVVYQNSYAATARIVTVVNQMFEDILQMV